MENKINKINCPLCAGKVNFWDRKNDHDLFCCVDCKLVFVSPIPNEVDVYDKSYFTGAEGGYGYVDYDSDKEPMIPTFNYYLDLLGKFGQSSGKLFDVGAATGFFLNIAKDRGYEVSGVEMSEYAANLAQKRGIDVSAGDLLGLKLNQDQFDVITLLDVLEHFKDPVKELLEAKRILKKGGLLVVNSPNGQSLLSRLFRSKWHLVLPPEHLFYFSPENLSAFMKKNGFEVLYSGNIGKKFTLQYVFIMLYKWQKFKIWNKLSGIFSRGFLSKIYIPINLFDNFFMVLRKND